MMTPDEEMELVVRRYFDHFLEQTLPRILREHQQMCPHGRVVSHTRYWLIGFGVGVGLAVPQVWNIIRVLTSAVG